MHTYIFALVLVDVDLDLSVLMQLLATRGLIALKIDRRIFIFTPYKGRSSGPQTVPKISA